MSDFITLHDFNPKGKYWGWKVWNPDTNDWVNLKFTDQLDAELCHIVEIVTERNKYLNLIWLILVSANNRIRYNFVYSVLEFWREEHHK
jgi:hypothetical protein